jgi:3-hydroxyisobutyrate dehydrogenase
MVWKQVSPAETRLGWIGTGVMGRSMCGHLIQAGFRMSVYNRSPEKCKPLVDMGASIQNSPRDVAANSDVVFSIVGFPNDVSEIYFGEQGIFAGAGSGQMFVDMTTSQPSLAKRIAEQALKMNSAALDAPVSGGDIGAKEARLSIMVGGDKSAFEALMPCWNSMGKTIVYQGGPGSGQHTKMVNQILIATNMIGVCESLLYAYRAGLDVETVLKSVSSGAAGSWSLTNLAPRILNKDFQPGFLVDHFVKDMGIVLEEAKAMKLALPGLALAHQLYIALQAHEGGVLGTQALILALAKLSRMSWPA